MQSEEEEDWHAEMSWSEWLEKAEAETVDDAWPPLQTSVPTTLDSLLMRTVSSSYYYETYETDETDNDDCFYSTTTRAVQLFSCPKGATESSERGG